jgi:hypothetical protein
MFAIIFMSTTTEDQTKAVCSVCVYYIAINTDKRTKQKVK